MKWAIPSLKCMLLVCSLAFLLALAPTQLSAHEFWLEPIKYQTNQGSDTSVSIRNGENFNGNELPFIPDTFEQLTLENATSTYSISGQLGDVPAIQQWPKSTGLNIFRFESRKNSVQYPEFDKFAEFAKREGVDWVLSAHKAQYGQEDTVYEVYRRYAKALINVGEARGNDVASGMTLEMVAIDNPYLETDKDSVKIQLVYQGNPLPDTQISIYLRQAGAQVQRLLRFSDKNGLISIPRASKQEVLINAVHMREPSLIEKMLNGTQWESLWASLTFRFPLSDNEQSYALQ